jgi:DedD protein
MKPAAPATAAASPGAAAEGAFWVQVTASNNRAEAEHVAGFLKSKGFPSQVETPGEAGASDKLFRVRVGPFVSRDEADQARSRLVTEGFKQAFIKR